MSASSASRAHEGPALSPWICKFAYPPYFRAHEELGFGSKPSLNSAAGAGARAGGAQLLIDDIDERDRAVRRRIREEVAKGAGDRDDREAKAGAAPLLRPDRFRAWHATGGRCRLCAARIMRRRAGGKMRTR